MPAPGEGTTQVTGALRVLGGRGWRDLSVRESCGFVWQCGTKPDQPANRMEGLGASYRSSNNFGVDAG